MKKFKINCLCTSFLAVNTFLAFVEVVSSGSQAWPPTLWFTPRFTLGSGGNNTFNSYNHPPTANLIHTQLNPHLLNTLGSCQVMGISCSGHTTSSCSSYCQAVGYVFSKCDGSCCLCSNSQTSMADYVSTSTLSPIITTRPKLLDLTAQPSSNQGYQQWAYDYLNQYKPKTKTPYTKTHYKPKSNPNQSTPKIITRKDKTVAVCHTQACHKASEHILSNMNTRADPCDNFYEFACGGFTRNTKIPRDKTEVTPFSQLRDKVGQQLRVLLEEPLRSNEPKPFRLAKTLYQSCMNTDLIEQLGLKSLKSVLENVGGWPVLEGTHWKPEIHSWVNFVTWFRELGLPTDYFIRISVDPDIKNVQKRVITLGEPLLGLTREVLIRGINEPAVRAYYTYMVDLAVLMGASQSTAESEMLEVLNFEVDIAKSFYRPGQSRGSSYYSPMTLAQLQLKFPSAPWLELFKRILSSKVYITPEEIVMVSAPHYIDAFFKLIAQTDIRTQSNYVIWRGISASVPYLNDAARSLQFEFTASITGQRQRIPRSKECTEIVSSSLGNAVGAMYVRRLFSKESKAQAYQMILKIKEAFLNILDHSDWMDEHTRGMAKDKAQNVKVHVGYPEEHMSNDRITALYSEYDFKPSDYFGNIRNLILSATNLAFSALKAPANTNDWVIHGKTSVVNAFYLPLENSIQFPAAILQDPFFDSSRPKYMNYGAIGWITGHELSHGFDDQGHQFDKDGNYANWWAPVTKSTYTTKTQCIINQYGSYSPAGSEMKINGVNSQGENIADNGGIKQAYQAYQSWVKENGLEKTLPGLESFSPNQLFWMSAANNWCSVHRAETLRHQILSGVHSPGEFRVRGTFANNMDFSRDFNCPSGSRMNPLKKCSVW